MLSRRRSIWAWPENDRQSRSLARCFTAFSMTTVRSNAKTTMSIDAEHEAKVPALLHIERKGEGGPQTAFARTRVVQGKRCLREQARLRPKRARRVSCETRSTQNSTDTATTTRANSTLIRPSCGSALFTGCFSLVFPLGCRHNAPRKLCWPNVRREEMVCNAHPDMERPLSNGIC